MHAAWSHLYATSCNFAYKCESETNQNNALSSRHKLGPPWFAEDLFDVDKIPVSATNCDFGYKFKINTMYMACMARLIK